MNSITITITVLIIAGVIIYARVTHRIDKAKKLKSEGKIIDRSRLFWEEEEIFELDAPYEEVAEGVKQTDYSDCAVDIYYNIDGKKKIVFKSGYSWNAALVYKGMSDTKHIYNLSFTVWKTRNGAPYDIFSMNIFMTQTEKMLLSLDPETMVETHRIQLNTKSKFF